MTTISAMNAPIAIRHDPAGQCFETQVAGLRCELLYELSDAVMRIHHTEVPPSLEGRGLAGALAHAALSHARAQGWRVQPSCSYVRSYMRRHPETLDLLVS